MENEVKNETSTQMGARYLNKDEIKLILPTYEKLKTQIAEIRSNTVKSGNQVINNIGIMGARGTGKTSILKTLEAFLLKDNKDDSEHKQRTIKNVVLPMIIPENMSESMNLMSSILGLFKKMIDNNFSSKKSNDSCWCSKENSVLKAYNELVEKYCYVQNEFRKIIVNNYSTASEYVDKSSKIFNADIDFLKDFNAFIDEVLHCGNEYHDTANNVITFDKDALIFIFVDDIDLSTSRCTDVVKTLLSYISHPRIVTVISGDLDTFEEALTIDFLRKENALNTDLLDVKFLSHSENNTLLERKQSLTYEYLKKILPPVYRHNVKHWVPENRAFFTSYTDSEQDDKKHCLLNLLDEVFKNYRCESYFGYYDENKEFKPVPQMFHIFDDTARGLNNVYNCLVKQKEEIMNYDHSLEPNAQEEKQKEEIMNYDHLPESNAQKEKRRNAFNSIKLFIETLVASNMRLNNYRNIIFEDCIIWGQDFKDTVIQFDNLKSSLNEIAGIRDNKGLDAYNERQNKTAIDRFAIFVLIDFASNILFQNKDSISYKDIKQTTVVNLCYYPRISGRNEIISVKSEKFMELLTEEKNASRDKNEKVGNLFRLSCILGPCEFIYIVHMYNDLINGMKLTPSTLANIIYFEGLNKNKRIINDIYVRSSVVLKSFVKDDILELNDYIVKYLPYAVEVLCTYSIMPASSVGYIVFKVFNDIINNFIESQTSKQNKAIKEYNDMYANDAQHKINSIKQMCPNLKFAQDDINSLIQGMNMSKIYEYYKSVWTNTVANVVTGYFNNNTGYVKNIANIDADKENELLKLILYIDTKEMWDTELGEIVQEKLDDKIKAILNDCLLNINNNYKITFSKEFINEYPEIIGDKSKCGTATGYYKLIENIENILKKDDSSAEKAIDYNDFIEMCGKPDERMLVKDVTKDNPMTIYGYNNNKRVWYGKHKVIKLKNALRESYMTLPEAKEQILNKYSDILYCYILKELHKSENIDVYKQSKDACDLANILSNYENRVASQMEKNQNYEYNQKDIDSIFDDIKVASTN